MNNIGVLNVRRCKYLYDNDTDSADDWTDYNDIKEYLLKRGYTEEQIKQSFEEFENVE